MIKGSYKKSAFDFPVEFRKCLRIWFRKVGKDYPWRRTSDPYAILVSEVMLQQTRIAYVLNKAYFSRFMDSFPDVQKLAASQDTELLKAWEGLGYYRRARMLRATASALITEFHGVFPEDEISLLSLPGIGPYTAAALLSFAFQKRSALVDGNVHRVLARLADDVSPIESLATRKKHMSWSRELCDPKNPRIHHYAMMELGQTICRPGVPHCEICPIASFCKTTRPHDLPIKKKPAPVTEVLEYAIWHRSANGEILLHQETGKRRTGLWKLPLRTKEECEGLALLHSSSYTITRYRVRLNVYLCPSPDMSENDKMIAPDDVQIHPMAAPFRKVVDHLFTY